MYIMCPANFSEVTMRVPDRDRQSPPPLTGHIPYWGISQGHELMVARARTQSKKGPLPQSLS